MKIYLDIIWLLNFLIDILLIFLTSIVLKRQLKKSRLIAGAMFASFYVFFLFTPFDHLAMNPIVKIVYSLFIILISFRFIHPRLFFQTWLTFYFVNFAIGGGLLGLHYFLQADVSFIKGTFATRTSSLGSPISWLFVIVGFPFMYWFSKQGLERIETEKIRFDQIYSVTVIMGDAELKLKGFVDSGNQLTDPISRRPVMFIDMTEVGEQFPEAIVQFTNRKDFSHLAVPRGYEGKLSIIPYRTVGEKHQFLWALRPDRVYVYENDNKFECSHVLLGLSYLPLSNKGDYNCILHPHMMQKKRVMSTNEEGTKDMTVS